MNVNYLFPTSSTRASLGRKFQKGKPTKQGKDFAFRMFASTPCAGKSHPLHAPFSCRISAHLWLLFPWTSVCLAIAFSRGVLHQRTLHQSPLTPQSLYTTSFYTTSFLHQKPQKPFKSETFYTRDVLRQKGSTPENFLRQSP